MQNSGTPVGLHRLGEERDDEAVTFSRLNEYNRIAKVNALFFTAPNAVALKCCLFTGQ